MSGLRVYSTSVTGSREVSIKSQQSEVTRILDGKRIQYQLVDISQDNALRDEMRALAGNPKATPPQIVNGDQYCGDYELFVEAVEQNTLQEFLNQACPEFPCWTPSPHSPQPSTGHEGPFDQLPVIPILTLESLPKSRPLLLPPL
uniref:SH3 domain-binding glutamic acid-rich-like protein 3 n=2 Tax=Rhinopithecus TaxID=542827 RepID=A0A2K6KRD7_RHIBE